MYSGHVEILYHAPHLSVWGTINGSPPMPCGLSRTQLTLGGSLVTRVRRPSYSGLAVGGPAHGTSAEAPVGIESVRDNVPKHAQGRSHLSTRCTIILHRATHDLQIIPLLQLQINQFQHAKDFLFYPGVNFLFFVSHPHIVVGNIHGSQNDHIQ